MAIITCVIARKMVVRSSGAVDVSSGTVADVGDKDEDDRGTGERVTVSGVILVSWRCSW
jgi:hypothetical protein